MARRGNLQYRGSNMYKSINIEHLEPEQQRILIAQGEELSDARALMDAGADMFVWEPQVYRAQDMLRALEENEDVKPVLMLPAAMQTQELENIFVFVCENKRLLSGVQLNNVGQFEKCWPVPVFGGQGLNVMNGSCAAFYTTLGAQRLTASCELSLKELKELTACGGNYEIEAYGRTQLMLLHHCPRRTAAGDQRQDAACNACAANGGIPAVYTDRKGYRFPAKRLRMEHGCVVRLYNSVPTDMARSAKKLYDAGITLCVSFTDEPLTRQKEIVASYRSILDKGCALHDITENATSGHLARGVE